MRTLVFSILRKRSKLLIYKMTQKKESVGFGSSRMKEISEMFKIANQVQVGAKKLQEELEIMEFQGRSGDVSVVLNGDNAPLKVTIGADAASENPEKLSELIFLATIDAYKKSTSMKRERLQLLTAELDVRQRMLETVTSEYDVDRVGREG